MNTRTGPDGFNQSSATITPACPPHASATYHLAINTGSSPLSRSQSDYALSSPNQLQGVVVESMKTPEAGPTQEAFKFDSHLGGNRTVADRGPGAKSFEPENSLEQRGIPWMLYRQRSHSVGAVVPSRGLGSADASLSATQNTRLGLSSLGRDSTSILIPCSPVSPMVAGYNTVHATASCQDHPDRSIYTEAGIDHGMEEDTCKSRSTRRANSVCTSGKGLYSACRTPPNGAADPSVSSALRISTESLNTATRATPLVNDDPSSIPFFNRHLRRTQQLRNMRMGLLGMQAGLPLPSSFLANNPSLSPNLSSATASTARTLTDPPVVPDDADAHGSKESKDISDTAVSPSTSDTCTLKPTSPYRRRCRPGVRRYIFRTQRLLSGQRPLSSSTVGSTDTTYLSSQHTTSPSKNAPMAPPRPPLWSSLYFIHGIDDYNRQRKRWVVGGGGFKGSRADPKVFFSNERTYLHWIKFGLLLGSMALTLLSFGKSTGLHVGLFLVMVTMCTLTYATTTFHLRHRWMIHLRRDVKYYDRLGPTLLSLALFLAYAINVTLTMNKINGKYADEEGYNFYNGDEPLDV